MKPTSVLLLDWQTRFPFVEKLRGILETPSAGELCLQQESLPETEVQPVSRLNELVVRAQPAVVFLAMPYRWLCRAKSFLQSLHEKAASPPVIVVADTEQETQPAEISSELFEMMKLGAADFITPPLTSINILPRFWRVLTENSPTADLPIQLFNRLSRPLIGESTAFLSAVSKIPLVAECDASVLIAGETGTGKEVCARAIHELSPRAQRPFIPINCGAIPLELVENELFGHERGAFTHANSAQEGLIQAADGGTLFLDEIDSLPLLAQVKLLRFLQEKEYKPLGSNKTRRADVRVITATNVDVERAVREGRLRQDLYFRLNLIPIVLPPLRERRADIPALAANFLNKYNQEFHKRVRGFAADALQHLALHDWPGNVRELEHVIARAVALSQHPLIQCADLALATPHAETHPASFQEMKARLIEQFERTYLQSLLIAHQGNISRAAEAAQKNRRAFFELLRKHGIKAEEFRESQ